MDTMGKSLVKDVYSAASSAGGSALVPLALASLKYRSYLPSFV